MTTGVESTPLRSGAWREFARTRVDRRAVAWTIVIGGAVIAGVLLRAWILAGPLGMVESDEAIVGLMARDALDGEFQVFYWVNYYSGSQEALLTAVVFAFAGSSVLAMKLVPIALFAASAVLTWRVGLRTVGELGARVGAALMWVWPPFCVYATTKARSAYAMGLLCGLVVLWMVLRLRERSSRLDAFVLGAALGCGIWSTQQTLLLAAPALLWLAWRRPGAFKLAPWGVAGGLVGGAPWVAWNVTHGFKAVLPVESVAGADSTYLGRFTDLFTTVLPEWLGLRLAYSLDWLVPAPLGALLTVVALAALVAAVVKRPRGLEPLLFVAAVYPFIYAATSFTYFVDEPRYLIFIAPVPALLLGRLLSRLPVAAVALAVATAASAFYLVRFEDQGRFRYLGQPADMGPLIALLEREGEDRVLADYWFAYRLVFESEERIVATSTTFVRNARYDRIVRGDPNPTHVFVEGSAADRAARARLLDRGYRRLTAGGWTAYVRP